MFVTNANPYLAPFVSSLIALVFIVWIAVHIFRFFKGLVGSYREWIDELDAKEAYEKSNREEGISAGEN